MMPKRKKKTIDFDYETYYVAKDSIGTVVFFRFYEDLMKVVYYDGEGIGMINSRVDFKLNDLPPKKRELMITLGTILMNAMLIQEEVYSVLVKQENDRLFITEEKFSLN